MSVMAQTMPPMYLRHARTKAGYASRTAASEAIPYSAETIGRHERGESEIEPEDIVQYAKGYNRPDILTRYCASCPVGCHIMPQVKDREFPLAAIRVANRLRKAAEYAERLDKIADDGQVDAQERRDFEQILTFLREFESTAAEVRLWAYSNGLSGGEIIHAQGI